MSVILDALKKLDREKSSRRAGVPNIAAEILRPDLPRPGKRILFCLAAVSIATAVITYAVMTHFGFLSRSLPPTVESLPGTTKQISSAPSEADSMPKSSLIVAPSPPASSEQTPPAPPEPISLPTLSPPAASQSPETVRDARDEMRRVPPKIQSDAENRTPASSSGEKETSPNLFSREAVVTPQTGKVPEQTPGRSPRTPPSLRISGIVWSEDPLKRIAVINGAAFTEGSVIEGVKILEIYPMRVRFSNNDRLFEIPLGSTIPIE